MIDKKIKTNVGGSKMEQALRTTPINGCKMDKRWFLN